MSIAARQTVAAFSLCRAVQAKCSENGDMPPKKTILARRKNLLRANECREKLLRGKLPSASPASVGATVSRPEAEQAQPRGLATSSESAPPGAASLPGVSNGHQMKNYRFLPILLFINNLFLI